MGVSHLRSLPRFAPTHVLSLCNVSQFLDNLAITAYYPCSISSRPPSLAPMLLSAQYMAERTLPPIGPLLLTVFAVSAHLDSVIKLNTRCLVYSRSLHLVLCGLVRLWGSMAESAPLTQTTGCSHALVSSTARRRNSSTDLMCPCSPPLSYSTKWLSPTHPRSSKSYG